MKVDVQQIKQRFGIIGNNPGLNRAIDVALQVALVAPVKVFKVAAVNDEPWW